MVGINITAESSELIVSLDTVKTHLRLPSEYTDEDELLQQYIHATKNYIENHTNLALVSKTFSMYLDEFPTNDYIDLWLYPVNSVVSIKYIDNDNNENTFAATEYSLYNNIRPNRIYLDYGKTWPAATLRSAQGVIINAQAGTNSATIAKPIIQAALLLISNFYENREDVYIGYSVVSKYPIAANNLLANYIVRV